MNLSWCVCYRLSGFRSELSSDEPLFLLSSHSSSLSMFLNTQSQASLTDLQGFLGCWGACVYLSESSLSTSSLSSSSGATEGAVSSPASGTANTHTLHTQYSVFDTICLYATSQALGGAVYIVYIIMKYCLLMHMMFVTHVEEEGRNVFFWLGLSSWSAMAMGYIYLTSNNLCKCRNALSVTVWCATGLSVGSSAFVRVKVSW